MMTLTLSSLFQTETHQECISLSTVTSKAQLIKLQNDDNELTELFKLADNKNDVDANHCHYTVHDGILMRVWRNSKLPQQQEFGIKQIVVPKLLRSQLLHIAHSIPAAGHLAAKKTLDRLLQHFWWPNVNQSVKQYCQTCDSCQRLGKGGTPQRAPLHNLPLVSEPFSRIAIDIIGPLPVCNETENRFILTILDLATHYPDAIPLKQHTAKDIALALTSVFTRFGFPTEILSDQGPELMSELMQIFCNDFGITQIRTSPWHPQTNGACERLNATIKSMLKACSVQFNKSWDVALPWVLFAYREVPVETLGLSPFELIFGRPVKGPLALIKHSWLHETDLVGAKQTIVEFMLETREMLKECMDIATKHAELERAKSKQWYDKRARQRSFVPGQKVLALLPLPGKHLQAKYFGPYVIEQQLGPVDYVIATPDRRKTKRVCHINLLKEYKERDKTLFPDFVPQVMLTTTPGVESIPTVSDISQKQNVDQMAHLTEQQQQDLKNLFVEYSAVFSPIPGKTTLATHHINIPPGTRPVRCTPYRLSPEKAEYLKKDLEELQKLGIIEETTSPWASPIVMVPKPDNTLRLCTDFRRVNALTTPDPYPMPRVEELLDRVGKAKFLTKLDMTKGYWQVPLDSESVAVSAFVTPFGHYAWKFMAFGLRNGPATFSRLVSKLLKGLHEFCDAFLDDIIIFSDSWEMHLKHLKQVFDRIKQACLTLNLGKCEFGCAELDYLGHHVGLGKVQPRAKKAEALLNFPRPTSRKQLQSFLGLAGYYRRFLPNFAHTASVLSDLLKKGQQFVWTPEREQAFVDLKSRLASRPVLRPPDFTMPFCIGVDASDVAVGACLFQVVDAIEHPICYISKKLDQHQRQYSTVEKEALALVLALRAFSVYVGSSHVTVYSDHSPLQFIQKMANHNQKLLRWNLELQQYNITVVHRPGKQNLIPDILSRPS